MLFGEWDTHQLLLRAALWWIKKLKSSENQSLQGGKTMLRLGENVLWSMFFSFLINWRTSVVIQHSDLNSRRDKAVCGKQCKTGSAIRHLCLNRGRMTRVGSRKYLQLIFQKSNSCCVRCQALRIMVHHLTTEGHCSNRRFKKDAAWSKAFSAYLFSFCPFLLILEYI